MSLLAARGLVKSYGARLLLDGVSVALRDGERVGLVGLNGAGKTTLGRILAGVEPPDQGEIMLRRGATVLLLEQEPRFDPASTPRQLVTEGLAAWEAARARHERLSRALTGDGAEGALAGLGTGDGAEGALAGLGTGDGAEGALAGFGTGDGAEGALDALVEQQHEAAAEVERLGGWQRDHEVESLLGHLGVRDAEAPAATLSGGERRRVALARLLIARPDLAVLDEPTNHLDVETIAWLEEYLIDEYPGALLLITHDRYLLDRVATRTLEIARGALHDYDGGYERYLEARAERAALAARTEDNRQNFLRRELEWLRRQPQARTTKQKARIDRAVAARDAPAPVIDRTATLALDATRSGQKVLELHGLRLEVPGRVLVRGLDLIVTQGERIGIVGRNGAGKTTLLRALVGTAAPAGGRVELGARTRIAYFDQERSGLDPEKSVFDNVAEGQSRFEVGGQVVDARTWLERFLFDPHQQRQPVGTLSGGEKARVALARLLRQAANLVVFDEPTNDLDVATLGALEEMLIEYGGTALVVTHDRWFLDRVATAILHLDGEGGAVRYAGNYSDFVRTREAAAQARAEAGASARAVTLAAATAGGAGGGSAGVGSAATGRATKPRPWSRRDQQELDAVVAAVDAAEAAVRGAEAALADPALYGRGGEAVRDAQRALTDARAEAERLTARWLELEERRGG